MQSQAFFTSPTPSGMNSPNKEEAAVAKQVAVPSAAPAAAPGSRFLIVKEEIKAGSHPIKKAEEMGRNPVTGMLEGPFSKGYLKTTSYLQGIIELLSQEFYRLMLSHQPKTQLFPYSSEFCQIYSHEIPDCKTLKEFSVSELRRRLTRQDLIDLGQIAVIAMFLNEGDLSLFNLLLGDRMYKVDGGWCCTRYQLSESKDYKFDITAEDMASLPYLKHYDVVHNWFDLVTRHGDADSDNATVVKKRFSALAEFLKESKDFRYGINLGSAKILNLPDGVLAGFVHASIGGAQQTSDLYNEMITRRNQLAIAMYQLESYRTYLATHGQQDWEVYLKELAEFKTVSGSYLFQRPAGATSPNAGSSPTQSTSGAVGDASPPMLVRTASSTSSGTSTPASTPHAMNASTSSIDTVRRSPSN